MKKIMFNDKYGLTQAVLEGRNTQTRRIINFHNSFKGQYVAGFHVHRNVGDNKIYDICLYDEDGRDFEGGYLRPTYKVGEIVAIAQSYKDSNINFIQCDLNQKHSHKWGHTVNMKGWNNKMFVQAEVMPHRIRITNVRIERLQEISDGDCLAEGITKIVSEDGTLRYYVKDGNGESLYATYTPQDAYAFLIDKVGKKGDWDRNPYVYVYDFELIK